MIILINEKKHIIKCDTYLYFLKIYQKSRNQENFLNLIKTTYIKSIVTIIPNDEKVNAFSLKLKRRGCSLLLNIMMKYSPLQSGKKRKQEYRPTQKKSNCIYLQQMV
jgi:hypothetical protein